MALTVEVVYALPGEVDATKVRLAAGATVRDAIFASGILDRYPETGMTTWKFGIFGQAAELDAPLADGDRVEIYRPLAMDPKAARRSRAAAAAQDSRRAASARKRRSV